MGFKDLEKVTPLPQMQQEMLKFWEENKIFEKSLQNKKGEVVFYDGPPFPTGKPHHGTVLVSFIKDMIARYHTMKGASVPRVWGWDCHGLPTETQVEKKLGLNDKKDIENIVGVDKFNEECFNLVSQNNDAWKEYVREMCRWVEYDNAYKTMDTNFMESVIWAFKECYNKGLIYKDYRVTPYCHRCETSLSISDTRESDSTRPRQDRWVIAKFKTDKIINQKSLYLIAWTTTPWTLPFNTALAVGADFDYSYVELEDCVIVGINSALSKYKEVFGETPKVIKTCKGSELVGIEYTPIFDLGKDLKGAYRVISAEYVSDEDGVGIVHIAPAFGEDDYWTAKVNNVPMLNFVDEKGRYTSEVKEFAGRNVMEANSDVIKFLKANNYILADGSLVHNYPHCWRCKEPLIYKAMDAWYFDVTKIKDELLKQNEKVNWVPDFIKGGRFGNWLNNARDWNISRNRYWSTPIPVWVCEDCGERKVLGSIQEIEQESGVKTTNLHKQYLDKITLKCKCGHTMRRVPEVLDCWFESGSVPFASKHYPFENKEWFDNHSPSDFVVEYTGQIRCWFYYLHVLSVALFNKPAYKNCIVHGTVLAKDGKKLSKSSKNYTDPMEIMKQYGTDPFRLYMYKSNAMLVYDMMFNEEGIKSSIQDFILPLQNSVSFFATYANIDGFKPNENTIPNSTNYLDKWILASLYETVNHVDERMKNYQIDKVIEPLEKFIDGLTNWYIRRSRRRFWESGFSEDKKNAYETLYFVLVEFSKCIAPFTPILAEFIYKNLTEKESVHLENFPQLDNSLSNEKLNVQIDTIRNIINLGRKLRAQSNIKVRQPLRKIKISLADEKLGEAIAVYENEIKEELNIKEIEIVNDINSIASCTFLPNFNTLKTSRPTQMATVIKQIKLGQFKHEGKTLILDDGTILNEEEFLIQYTAKDGFGVASYDNLVVSLDTKIDDELIKEGIAREIIRNIQDERKALKYNITDKILLEFSENVPSEWLSKICQETLGTQSIVISPDSCLNIEISGEQYTVKVSLN